MLAFGWVHWAAHLLGQEGARGAAVCNQLAGGNRNTAELHRALKVKGFTGRYDTARRYVNRLIGSNGRSGKRQANATRLSAERTPPSPRKLSFRVAIPKPDIHSARVPPVLRVRNAVVHAALGLAEELMSIIRRTTVTPLAGRVDRALASGDRDLANLARSLRSDAAAVQAALTERWSNGQVEGRVRRLKLVKGTGYGRAGFALLKARVLNTG